MLTQFEREANLSDLMDYQARTRPDAEMLVFNDERYSWGQGDRIINRVANGLIALGIGRNDKVAILAHNCPAFFVTLFGILRAGACAVPLSGMADVGALRLMLEDCGAKLLCASAA